MKRFLYLFPLITILVYPAFAQTGTQHGVFLTWTASTGDVTYNIYRSTDGVTFVKLNSTPVAVTNYVDPTTDLVVSKTYEYDVTALDATGDESGASNIASVTTGTTLPSNPSAPTGCNAKLQ